MSAIIVDQAGEKLLGINTLAAKVNIVRDETGFPLSFKTEGDFPRYGNDDERADPVPPSRSSCGRGRFHRNHQLPRHDRKPNRLVCLPDKPDIR